MIDLIVTRHPALLTERRMAHSPTGQARVVSCA